MPTENLITGTSGNDTLVGGTEDVDIVRYTGLKERYIFNNVDGNTVYITDLTGAEGSDMLVGFDQIIFRDVTMNLRGGIWVGVPVPIENAFGGAGNDAITGNGLVDSLYGGAGNDTLSGAGGHDLLQGNQGNDRLYGGTGNDRLFGGKDDDLLYGNQHFDLLSGNNGSDTLRGGRDNDTLHGGRDNDSVFGDLHNDEVYGDLGDDVLHGGQGTDTLYGGDGDDTLWGDLGGDYLYGGDGTDVFAFLTIDGWERLEDFTPGEDILQFSSAIFSSVEEALSTLEGSIMELGNNQRIILPYGSVLDASDILIM